MVKRSRRSTSKNKDKYYQEFKRQFDQKYNRRIQARTEEERGIWYSLGMFGLVGWAIAIPTLIGIFIGVWIDTNWPGPYSWTVILLFLGVILGCFNAWFWIQKESRED